MDKAALEAQELWLAAAACVRAANDDSGQHQVRSLSREIEAVKKVLERNPTDAFSRAVVDSIAKAVYTEEAIRERFLRVEKMAKRTALIGDEGGSLFKYLLSYLQSALMLAPSTVDVPSKDEVTDVDALNTFDLVWLARASLDRGDLEQAVKYVTLLKGEPKNVAGDWLNDARVLLETRQACRALMVHASAVGVEALPKK